MRAGALDRRITIRRYTVAGDDGYGNEIREWADLATVWAAVQQEGGREYFAQGGIQAERKIVFRLRWTDVAVSDRIQYDGGEFDIHDVRELGRKDGLELHATARA